VTEDIRKPSYQARVRAESARERFDYVLGPCPKMKSGKGKYYWLNYKGLKEAYDAAVEKCPEAADAILVMIWDAAHNYNTLEFLAKDFEEAQQPTPDAYDAACRALNHWRSEAKRLGEVAGVEPRQLSDQKQ
jgi:hypothetical protein